MTVQRDLPVEFRTLVNDAAKGAVLKPILHAYLFEARFPGRFTVEFRKEEHVRKPDGWFHPSEHPLWPERMLYYYLTEPDSIEREPLEYMGTMSVTMGKAMHSFIGMCLKDQGVLLGKEQLEAEGILCDDDGEPTLVDEQHRRRGHTDGILQVHMPTFPHFSRQIYEFKTSNDMKLRKLEDLDLDAFRETWPSYWTQVQEYLAMSGYQVAIVLFLGMGFPWTMKEFHIPADVQWQQEMKAKYTRVLTAVEDRQVPNPCCAPGSAESTSCPARHVCPIGQLTVRMR